MTQRAKNDVEERSEIVKRTWTRDGALAKRHHFVNFFKSLYYLRNVVGIQQKDVLIISGRTLMTNDDVMTIKINWVKQNVDWNSIEKMRQIFTITTLKILRRLTENFFTYFISAIEHVLIVVQKKSLIHPRRKGESEWTSDKKDRATEQSV